MTGQRPGYLLSHTDARDRRGHDEVWGGSQIIAMPPRDDSQIIAMPPRDDSQIIAMPPLMCSVWPVT
jgi:hypothetical protein